MVRVTADDVDRIADRTDLETKIGQLFIYVQLDAPTEAGQIDREFLREYRPGGVIVYRGNVDSRDQIGTYLAELQGLSAELGLPGPMIVCVDHRGGDSTILEPAAGGLEFPAPIAQTAIDDDLEVVGEEIGGAVARDVLDAGFNLNLAPYGDFLERGNIKKFVFGNAMMGSDADANAALSRGLVRGMRAADLATTYCVFPGGYGSIDRDPHHFTGVVEADEEEILDRYLSAPTAAFDAGVEAVMLSHHQFPALDPECRPAAYSPPVIRGLLRDELGYDGLVMTDAIRMAGATEAAGSSEEAAIRAIEAGADVILCATWNERFAVREAVRDGRLSEARIDEAFRRVLELKASLAETGPPTRSRPDPVDQGRMAARIEQSITWLHEPDDRRPLAAAGPIVALAPWRSFLDAAHEIAGEVITTIRLPDSDTLFHADVSVDDRIEFVQRRIEGDQHLVLGSSTADDLALAARLSEEGYDLSVVHAGRVFEAEGSALSVPTLLSYSHQPLACRKALETLFGTAEARGSVPVPLSFGSANWKGDGR